MANQIQEPRADENYCRSCGSIIKKEAEICPKCGVRQSFASMINNPSLTMVNDNIYTTQSVVNSGSTIKFAGFWVRFAALFIDQILIYIASFIVGFILGILLAISGASKLVSLFAWPIGLIITWLYFIIMTDKYQATLGKMALGLIVISDKQEKASLKEIVLRETIGKIISGLTLGIGYFMAGWTKKKQALHDLVADTWVVYKDPSKKKNAAIIIIIAIAAVILVVAFIGILSSIVLVSLNSARQKATTAAFKAETQSIVPSLIIACDEKHFITKNDLGSPKYFDPADAFANLSQNCTGTNNDNFSIIIQGIGDASTNHAVCTEKGCTFN